MAGPPPASWAVDPAQAGARLVIDGLWRLRIPNAWPGVDHVNAYAVDLADGGIMLVDCGSAGAPSCTEALEAALAAAGRRLQEVRVLVATHAHSDHVGQTTEVLARSDAETWSHPADWTLYDIVREPGRYHELRARRARREGVPPTRVDAYASTGEESDGVPLPPPADHALADGVRLPSALGDWEVIETPGHAASHVCLWQPQRGLLICGDLLCIAFTPWFDYGFSADPVAETLASLDRLEALGPIAIALPGHGRPLTDVPAVIALHRAGHAQRLDDLRRALAQSPGPGYDLSLRLHGDEDDTAAAAHLVEVCALLAHLRARGEVVRDESAPIFTYHAVRGGRT